MLISQSTLLNLLLVCLPTPRTLRLLLDHPVARGLEVENETFFFLQRFSLFFAQKSFFFQTLLSSPHISINTALRKALTNPRILGGHNLNAAARFMTHPKL